MSAPRLRQLLEMRGTIEAPGAYDALSARLIERAGFPCVYVTGFGATASRLGMPDLGLMTQTEMTDQARNIVRAVSAPVIADADTGYGGLSNIHRTVREFVQAGVAAIHIEDQAMPKRCGQMAGARLLDQQEAIGRLRCALAARDSNDLLIIARTDALPVNGPEDAIARVRAFQDAGADLVFVDGLRSIAHCERIGRDVEGPKVLSVVDGTEIAGLASSDFAELGYAVVLYPLTALLAATSAAQGALERLAAAGLAGVESSISYWDFNGLVDLGFHGSLDDRFGSSLAEPYETIQTT
jgi:2-methylisocitrate lyase-like PEP mutase family enzyme